MLMSDRTRMKRAGKIRGWGGQAGWQKEEGRASFRQREVGDNPVKHMVSECLCACVCECIPTHVAAIKRFMSASSRWSQPLIALYYLMPNLK